VYYFPRDFFLCFFTFKLTRARLRAAQRAVPAQARRACRDERLAAVLQYEDVTGLDVRRRMQPVQTEQLSRNE